VWPGRSRRMYWCASRLQFRVDQWGEFLKRRLIAIAPGDQQSRDVFRGVRLHTTPFRPVSEKNYHKLRRGL